MANVGARKDLPLGDFGAFEGDMVVTGTLNFRGQRPAPHSLSEGDTVHLLVQAEVREGRTPLAFDEDGNANPDGASDEELLELEQAAASEEATEDES